MLRQRYTKWRAAVVGTSATSRADTRPDDRVAYIDEPFSAELVNRVVQESAADFVVFLQPGDRLTERCLLRVMSEAHREPLLRLAYWDDLVTGSRRDRRYRPAWSPDMLLSANYIGRAFALRRSRYVEVGGLRSDAGDAYLWDLLLRADLTAQEVLRIPSVLSSHTDRGDVATDDGRRAVEAASHRRGWAASVHRSGDSVRLRWTGPLPHVTVIIPTRHNRRLLDRVFSGLRSTHDPQFDVVVVDNGPRTADNEAWYAAQRLPLTVLWWEHAFNYSAVNNFAARHARGDVLVFLNDDVEVLDPGWLREVVGWALVDGVGVAGMQLLDSRGLIQHGGVVVGVGGFAGHLFQGMRPGSGSLLGSTAWYRDTLAVTAACLAVRRSTFDAVGGFDERFVLCGSDVALGLTMTVRGLRNVCTPMNGLRHLESATRGSAIPVEDFYTSYWAYQPWLRGGDPYYSPGLALEPGTLRPRNELDVNALDMASQFLGKAIGVYRSESDLAMAGTFAVQCRASWHDVAAVHALHETHREPFAPRSINWFIPGLDSPFYGGINTALRVADHLARHHSVKNRFVVSDRAPEHFIRTGAASAFPRLSDSDVTIADSAFLADTVPAADIAIATLWTTAYEVARYPGARRKFYMIQDFEPRFYPAGTMYALAEESYRLGLYGLCNTQHLADLYASRYGGSAFAFTPAVDTTIFHNEGRREPGPREPVTVFVYARPGHWRNCWELAYASLAEVKRRLGDRVRIVAAGSWAIPEDSGPLPFVHQLGLLDYRATGALYRQCDIGLALTVSEHPSYLPLELMACGVAVVAFDNPAGHWLLEHERNSLLTSQTVDGLAGAVERLVSNPPLRRRLAAAGGATIARRHSDWDAALSGIHEFLSDPESQDNFGSQIPAVAD